MAHVRITGFRRGLQKVAMTKTIRFHTELNLAAAKMCTDSVLAGETVTLNVPLSHDAKMLANELIVLGAFAESLD